MHVHSEGNHLSDGLVLLNQNLSRMDILEAFVRQRVGLHAKFLEKFFVHSLSNSGVGDAKVRSRSLLRSSIKI